MNQIWIVIAVLVALLIFMRIRSRRKSKPRRPPATGPRIHGIQVNAFVLPRMGDGCLYDNGVQYGKGFRRKEGPVLPHDAECRCEAVPFSFTSSEVFNGALRNVGNIQSTIPDFSGAAAAMLIDRLKAVEAHPLPEDESAYLAAIGPSAFAHPYRRALEAFLSERYAYLRLRNRAGEPARISDNLTPTDMESAETT